MTQSLNMPDVRKGADLSHVYTWLYNDGLWGKLPTIGEMLELGWGQLLAMGIIYYDPTNKDVRYRDPLSGYFPVTAKRYTYHLAYQPFTINTTDDTYKDLSAAILSYLQDASREGASFAAADLDGWLIEVISVYQNSAGALGCYLAFGAAGAEVVINYRSNITASTIYDMTDRRWIHPLYDPTNPTYVCSFKWSAAAGAADKINIQLWKRGLE